MATRSGIWSWLVVGLGACGGDGQLPPAPDLSEALGPGQARAGVVSDPAALFGGGSAEGRVGDVKLYNDRIQVILQGLRQGDYYVRQPGGVVDADLVRAEGVAGRDFVDEWAGMFGLARLMDANAVEIVQDGQLGGPAIVRVSGPESPMELVTGAVGSPGFIPDLGLEITTDYILWPDRWWIEVRSTITATEAATVEPGDFLMGGLEVATPWHPGVGFGPPDGDARMSAYVEDRDGLVVAIAAPPGELLGTGGSAELLTSLADIAGGFADPVELQAGESTTYERYYGIGPDLAALTDALLELDGQNTERVEAQVLADGQPLAGARVHLLVEDLPYTMAISDEEGRVEARVPAGSEVRWLADGRGRGLFPDVPVASGGYGPYTEASVREQSLRSVVGGADGLPPASGYGAGDEEDPLQLQSPGRLELKLADGGPAEVRLTRLDAEPEVDERVIRDRPSGYQALGWAADGSVELAMEPGSYHLLVHRGLRYELYEEELRIDAGEQLEREVALEPAYAHPGWLLADPHSHAGPSGDGQVSMTERLLVMAGVGLQVHMGTDHDHIVDYAPLRDALGLKPWLATVVADEVSPVIRGHVNAYPLEQRAEPNGGAWPWWSELVESTEAQFDALRAQHPEATLQLNHPLDNGVGSAAGWSPGRIDSPEMWTEQFGAVEVLNSGDYEEYLDFYLDLTHRGLLSTPVGVSDSHGHTSGDVGLSATFLGMGTDDPAAYSDEALREAMAARRSVVTRGPFLDLSIDPGSMVVGPTVLKAQAHSPSWIGVDRLILLENGVEVARVEGREAEFTLSAAQDAAYAVIAEGDAPMQPLSSLTPWAMSSPILLDVDGAGWEPPLPPLALD